MELIEKMCKYAYKFTLTREEERGIRAIADEIEAEIAERYMELPVDADGVPIRVGDKLEAHLLKDKPRFTAMGILYDGEQWYVKDGESWAMTVNIVRHVKPRTLEDVLAEVENGELSIKDAEAEIRELLGVEK